MGVVKMEEPPIREPRTLEVKNVGPSWEATMDDSEFVFQQSPTFFEQLKLGIANSIALKLFAVFLVWYITNPPPWKWMYPFFRWILGWPQ